MSSSCRTTFRRSGSWPRSNGHRQPGRSRSSDAPVHAGSTMLDRAAGDARAHAHLPRYLRGLHGRHRPARRGLSRRQTCWISSACRWTRALYRRRSGNGWIGSRSRGPPPCQRMTPRALPSSGTSCPKLPTGESRPAAADEARLRRDWVFELCAPAHRSTPEAKDLAVRAAGRPRPSCTRRRPPLYAAAGITVRQDFRVP